MAKKISFSQLRNEMKQLELKAENIEPILLEIANSAKNISELSFENEVSPFKEKWQPLSKKTLQSKKGSKILTESGMLQTSLRTKTNFNNKGKDKVQGRVSIGTNLEYAKIHQFGGKAGKALRISIPARPFLPMNDKGEIPNDLKEDIRTIILRHLNMKG